MPKSELDFDVHICHAYNHETRQPGSVFMGYFYGPRDVVIAFLDAGTTGYAMDVKEGRASCRAMTIISVTPQMVSQERDRKGGTP